MKKIGEIEIEKECFDWSNVYYSNLFLILMICTICGIIQESDKIMILFYYTLFWISLLFLITFILYFFKNKRKKWIKIKVRE